MGACCDFEMSRLLHILVQGDEVALDVMAGQRLEAGNEVMVVDLRGAEPDYEALVSEIFEADSVAVW
jgi:hypothetical protein